MANLGRFFSQFLSIIVILQPNHPLTPYCMPDRHRTPHQHCTSTPKWGVGGLMVGVMLFLTGCQPPDHPNQANTQNTTLSSTRTLGLGRQSAIFGYLAKRWQILQINEIPAGTTALLDLSDIENGNAQLSLGKQCTPIRLRLDISQLNKGIISTKEIERELDDCSDEFEDRLMSTLADLTYVEKNPASATDTLVLSAYQDKIVLIPAP